MNITAKTTSLVFLLVLAMSLAGCLAPQNDGQVTVYVKDQPTENFESLFVTLTEVSVHNETDANEDDGEWLTLVDTTREVDLLAYSDEDSRAFLGEDGLQEGRYSMIRLMVSEARGIENDGDEVDIEVTSGVLRVVRSFNVSADETTRIILDFDLDRDGVLVQQGGQGGQTGQGWRMTPVIGRVIVEEDVEDDGQDQPDE